jgi:Cupin-like domain
MSVGLFLVLLFGSVAVVVARGPAASLPPPPPFFSNEEWESYRPCTIPRYTQRQWPAHFGPAGLLPALYPTPVILVRPDRDQAQLRNATRRETLAASFPSNFTVTISSSNSLSQHKRNVLLSDYLDHVWNAMETPLPQSANDTWYLFGETYSAEWQALLSRHALPPCTSCTKETVAVSFGIGNAGSGVSWHTHGPGFSESLHGAKHWVLYPPSIVTTINDTIGGGARQSNLTSPIFHDKDQSSRQWMHDIYPYIEPKPWQCTIMPNEALYFPHAWWHATINLDRYTAFVSTFTTEHLVPPSKTTMLLSATGSRQGERHRQDPFPLVPEQSCDAR